MINLAGNKDADHYIQQELAFAKIEAVKVKLDTVHSEVPYTFEGRVGPFKLDRRWYYWAVEGLVPIQMAEELYADPCGKVEVRVAGHCACPPPFEWAKWYLPNGREVLDLPQKEEAEKFANSTSSLRDIGIRILKEYDFAADPSQVPKIAGYVPGYHIDSQLGLRLFADAAEKYKYLFNEKYEKANTTYLKDR